MQDFEKEILACVGPANTPTKKQVNSLCQRMRDSPVSEQILQEILLSRLERSKEFQVSTLEIEHILVVLRQCCFIAPMSFVRFLKDRLYVIASFCDYKDRFDPKRASDVEKAALALRHLLKDDLKLNEERRNSAYAHSASQPSIWLSPSSPRTENSPLLSPTHVSFLPTPDASPVRTSYLSIMTESSLVPCETSVQYKDIVGDTRHVLSDVSTLGEIRQATSNENRYSLENGSQKHTSALRNNKDQIKELNDMFVLQSVSPTWDHSPAKRSFITLHSQKSNHSLVSAQKILEDLTPFVRSQNQHFARGGYATIYLAKYVRGDKSINVVKKVMDKSSSSETTDSKRILREINAWADLKHDNVGLLYGFTREKEDRIGLISPFYEKGNINHYIKQSKNLSGKQLLQFMRGIAAGVMYLHGEGVIHGDIKGTNIMVGDDNKPKLIDFGVSRIDGVNGFTTTKNGTSWAWAAPELLEIKEDYDPPKTQKSDIYALSCTFVELMTGSPPLPQTTTPKIINAILNGQKPGKPEPFKHRFHPGKRLWNYMKRCWKEEKKRPVADEVVKFLNELKDITEGYD